MNGKRRPGLPSTVKVLGTRFKVSQRANLRIAVEDAASTVYAPEEGIFHEHDTIGVLGLTDTDASVIVIETCQSDDKFGVTFIHELLHAVMAEAGIRDAIDSDTEERVVKRISPILRQVLKDNPRVYTFLTGRRLW